MFQVRFGRSLVLGVSGLFCLLYFASSAQAKPILQLGDAYAGSRYLETVQGTEQTGARAIVQVIDTIIFRLKGFFPPILMIYIVYLAIRMIVAQGEEEEIKKVTSYLLYLVLGLSLIVMAEEIRDVLAFTAERQSFLSEDRFRESSSMLNELLLGFVKFLRYILGGFAVFYSIRSGALIVFASGEEEQVNKQKEVFMWGFIGLIVVMFSDALVTRVLFPAGGEDLVPGTDLATDLPDVSQGVALMVRLTNLLLSIIGGLAIVTLVAGGVMYSVSASNEERATQATKLIYGSLLGLIVAFSSYTIVSEFVPGGREISTVAPPGSFEGLPQGENIPRF